METHEKNYLGQYAGFTSRLIAYTIDLVVAIAMLSLLWWLINVTVDILKIRDVIELLGWEDPFAFLQNRNEEFVLRGFVFIVGIGFYHVFFLTLANRTIGKAIMGLQVVPLSGGRIGIVRAILRYLGYIVSAIVFFLGFVWIIFSRKRQGWHDKIARTCVVYSWDAKPDEVFLHRQVQRLQEANEKRFGAPPGEGIQ
jgi:uncharacterized RDD family membrane protein YckC